MRTFTLALAATVAALTLTACGSDTDPGVTGSDEDLPSIGAPSSAATEPAPATNSPEPDNKAAVASTLRDVEAYAVQLEQVFFGSGYPKDLAGAIKVADRLALDLSAGNRIASYVFDADAQEFQLCVQNTSGAWAIYDTEPMSTLKSGAAGGCPDA